MGLEGGCILDEDENEEEMEMDVDIVMERNECQNANAGFSPPPMQHQRGSVSPPLCPLDDQPSISSSTKEEIASP